MTVDILLVTRAVEILVISAVVYGTLRFLRGTVGGGILVGIAWIAGAGAAGWALFHQVGLDFQILPTLANWFLTLAAFALLVIFQPELRRGLVRLGRNPWQEVFAATEFQIVDEIVEAMTLLSREKVGALVALEREVGLRSYIESSKGVKVDAEVTAALLRTLFWPNTALHDGGVVIRERRVAAAGCFFPLSDNPALPADCGSRHRAALGLSEETDAVVVVASEETGALSVAMNGQLTRNLAPEALRDLLKREYVRRDRWNRRKESRRKEDHGRLVQETPHGRPGA